MAGEVVAGVTVTGQDGEVRLGGERAAVFGNWTLMGTSASWLLTADLRSVDQYWLDYGGAYELRLAVGDGTWRWRGVTVSRGGATLSVRGSGEPEALT